MIRSCKFLGLCTVALAAWFSTFEASSATNERLPKGFVFYQTGFEGAPPLEGWTGPAKLEAGWKSPQAATLERQSPEGTAAMISIRLPVEQMRGYKVFGSMQVKAENISDKPHPWNGVKFMLAIETPDQKLWPQAELGTGSFDWQRGAFSTTIPADATRVQLILGLEEVTGKVWFDAVKISVIKPIQRAHPQPRPGPAYKGHALPRLRGAMVGPHIDAAGLRAFGEDWNANLIRWQLIRHYRPGQPAPIHDYDQWLEGELKRLDAALPFCEQFGIRIALDLHSPPGGKATISGYVGSDDRLFTDRQCQDKFVAVWRRLALRYKDVKVIWGYDIANEPVENFVEEDCDDWHALATRTARAIREIDPDRAIIVEAPPWGSPDSLRDFTPIEAPNIVYSAHMYVPGKFTHQGVFKHTPDTYTYPGEIDGKLWDRQALEAALQPVIDFQRNYNVHIYMGEFSAIRWAPDQSAYRYLKDVIDIFEKHGWDWSYHAFREWQGWSVEHDETREHTQPAAEPTRRQQLLQEWFAKNRKPVR